MSSKKLSRFVPKWLREAQRPIVTNKAKLEFLEVESRIAPAALPAPITFTNDANPVNSKVFDYREDLRLNPPGSPPPNPPASRTLGSNDDGSLQFGAQVVSLPSSPQFQVMVNSDLAEASNEYVGVLSFTQNGGQNWTRVSNLTRLADPTLVNTTDFYDKIVTPSVALGADKSAYVVSIQRTPDQAFGEVVFQKFTFAAGAYTPGGTVSLYKWGFGLDKAYNPFITVNNNNDTLTDKTNGTYIDPISGTTLTDTTAKNEAIFVGWNIVGTQAQRFDSPAETKFNPDVSFVVASNDGGVKFTSIINTTDDAGALFGPFRATDLPSQGKGYAAPQLLVAPAQTAVGSKSQLVTVTTPTAFVPQTAPAVGGNAQVRTDTFAFTETYSGTGNTAGNKTVDNTITVQGDRVTNTFNTAALGGGSITNGGTITIPSPVFPAGVYNNLIVRDLNVGLQMKQDPNNAPTVNILGITLNATYPTGTKSVTLFNNRNAADGTVIPNGRGEPRGLPSSGNALGQMTARDNGNVKVAVYGTTFDDQAPRRIDDTANNFDALIGHYRPEGNFNGQQINSLIAGKTAAEVAAATWSFTTVYASTAAPPPPQVIQKLTFDFSFGLKNNLNTDVTIAGSVSVASGGLDTNTFGTSFSPVGVPIHAVAAFDRSLSEISGTGPTAGNFSQSLYVAWVHDARSATGDRIADRGSDIYIARSTNNGAAWGVPYRVNQDAAQTIDTLKYNVPTQADNKTPNADTKLDISQKITADNFSGGNRLQFGPAIAVDPKTGTVGVSWFDSRLDASQTRAARFVSTSIDGGVSFSGEVSLDVPKGVIDAISAEGIFVEPIPSNATGLADGYGTRTSLIYDDGKLWGYWTGNVNANQSKIRAGVAITGTGPRVVDNDPLILSDTGVVIGSTQNPTYALNQVPLNGDIKAFTDLAMTTPLPAYNGRDADGKPFVNGFKLVFDRPIDPTSFKADDITVVYTDTAGIKTIVPTNNPFEIFYSQFYNNNTADQFLNDFTNVPPINPLADDFWSDVPGSPVSKQRFAGSREFFVPFQANQFGIGTYSYFVGPDIRDRYVRQEAQNFFRQNVAAAIPDNPVTPLNSVLNIAATGTITGGAGIFVAVNIQHSNVRDLQLRLISPTGTPIILANAGILPTGAQNFSNTRFAGSAPASPLLSTGVAPYTGIFAPVTGLAALDGQTITGNWTLEVTDTSMGNSGRLFNWSLTFPATTTITGRQLAIGNNMDQNANGTPGEFSSAAVTPALPTAFPITLEAAADTYGVPLVAPGNAQRSPFWIQGADQRVGFATERQPLGISGPFFVGASLPGQATPNASGDTLYLNKGVQSFDIHFDRKMAAAPLVGTYTLAPTTKSSTGVIKITGPNGPVYDTITVTQVDGNTFNVAFTKVLELQGQYSIEFGADVKSFDGFAIDTNKNAGILLTTGIDPYARSFTSKSYQNTNSIPIVANGKSQFLLNVPDNFFIQQNLQASPNDRLLVTVNITHTFVPDLTATLIAPDGTTIPLFSKVGGGAANTSNFKNTTFEDSSPQPIQFESAPFDSSLRGNFTPQQSLSRLNNRFSGGTWSILITNSGAVTGIFNNWSLTLPTVRTNPLTPEVTGLGESVADRFQAGFRVLTQDPTNQVSKQQWTPLGPNNISGRDPANITLTQLNADGTFANVNPPPLKEAQNINAGRATTVAVDPTDISGNTVYVGGARGGVWKTTNFLTLDPVGPTWMPLTDFGAIGSVHISSIALFPRNNDPNQTEVFALTGEGSLSNTNTNGGAGIGILYSKDGGRTWKILDSTNNADPANSLLISSVNSSSRDRLFLNTRGNKIIIDPTPTTTNELVVYMALTSPSDASRGVWRSRDSGRTWTRLAGAATNATDLILAKGSRPLTGTSRNLEILYAAYENAGVFFTTQAPSTATLTPILGDVGTPFVRTTPNNGQVSVGPDPLNPNSELPTNLGRMVLTAPELTNNPLTDSFYQGWLYALGRNGTQPVLFMTKDFGQNWVRVRLPINTATRQPVTTLPARTHGFSVNDETAGEIDITGNNADTAVDAQPLSLSIDPFNPNIVYIAGVGVGVTTPEEVGGSIRIDTTMLADTQAMYSYSNDDAATAFRTGSLGGVVGSKNDPRLLVARPNPDNPNTPDTAQQFEFINLVRDPDNPTIRNTTLRVDGITAFVNDGDNARWRPFYEVLLPDGYNPQEYEISTQNPQAANNVRSITTVLDRQSGRTRVIYATDFGVYSAIDDGTGELLTKQGYSAYPRNTRNGNLNLNQFITGAVQPSQLAADLAGVFTFGGTQDGGSVGSSPSTFQDGATNFVGVRGDEDTRDLGSLTDRVMAVGSAADQTGSGISYTFRSPGSQGTTGLPSDFMRVAPSGKFTQPISRTGGLIAPGENPAANAGQWKRSEFDTFTPTVGDFVVNPVDKNGALIFSNDNVYRTTALATFTTDNVWFKVGTSGNDFNGNQLRAAAFGAPDPAQLGELNNYLVVGTTGGKLYRTFSGTGPWTQIGNFPLIGGGTDTSDVRVIVTDPFANATNKRMFVLTSLGVYSTDDASVAAPVWKNLNSNLFTLTRSVFPDNDATTTDDVTTALVGLDNNRRVLESMAVDWRTFTPTIYVGGEGGVFRLQPDRRDPGNPTVPNLNWSVYPNFGSEGVGTPDAGGMPTVRVTDLDLSLGNLYSNATINPSTQKFVDDNFGFPNESAGGLNLLIASTYGRGQFAIRINNDGLTPPPSKVQPGPRVIEVINTNPQNGPSKVVQVRFSGAVDPVTFSPADVTVFDPNGVLVPVSSVKLVPRADNLVTPETLLPAGSPLPTGVLQPRDLYEIAFTTPQTIEGFYRVVITPTLSDLAGNLMNQNANGKNGERDDPQILGDESDDTFTTYPYLNGGGKFISPPPPPLPAPAFSALNTPSFYLDLPHTTVAGQNVGFVLQALDQTGLVLDGSGVRPDKTVVPVFTGPVTITLSDLNGVISKSTYTFVATDKGQINLDATFKTSGVQFVTITPGDPSTINPAKDQIIVFADVASKFEVKGHNTPITAGDISDFKVTALDQFGNIATGYTGTVSVTSTDAKAIFTPATYTFTSGKLAPIPTDNGVHTFVGGSQLISAGKWDLIVTDTKNSLLTGKQADIVVNPGIASTFTVFNHPSPVTAGTKNGFDVQVSDKFGNFATGYTGIVQFTTSDPNGSFLINNYQFTSADGGKKSFAEAVILKTVGTHSITATDSVTPTVTGKQVGIVVNPAPASRLAVQGHASPTKAGTNQSFRVIAFDPFGNQDTNYLGTVSFSTTDPQGIFNKSTFTFSAANKGDATIAAVDGAQLRTVGTWDIKAVDTVTNSIFGSQVGIVVTPDTAASLKVSDHPTPVVAGNASTFKVTALDKFGNTDTNYLGTIGFSTTDPAGSFALKSFSFTSVEQGVATITNGSTLKTVGTWNVTATDLKTSSITGTQTGIVVIANVAKSIVLSGHPLKVVAGTNNPLTVTAFDEFLNIATGYTGSVQFTTTDPQGVFIFGPNPYTFSSKDNGTVTLGNIATLRTVGKWNITATDLGNSNLTSTITDIVVTPAAATSFKVVGYPSPTTAGFNGKFTATALDPFNNIDTNYKGTVDFKSSDPNFVEPLVYTFDPAVDKGIREFTGQFQTAGTQSVTIFDQAKTTVSGTQSNILVVPNEAASYKVDNHVSPTIAGNTGTVRVTVTDKFGNFATGYTGTVRFKSSDPLAKVPVDYTFTAKDGGVKVFTDEVILKTAGTQSITAFDVSLPTIQASQVGIVVTPATAATFTVVGHPSPVTAGTSSAFTITAFDTFGNRASNYTGTVSFGSSDTQAVFGPNYTFVAGDNGQKTLSTIELRTAGQQSITVTDVANPSLTASQGNIKVIAAAAANLKVSDHPSPVRAGSTNSVKVSATDKFGNVADTYTGRVRITSSDKLGVLPTDYSFTAGDAGSKTFTGVELRTVGTQSITATDLANSKLTNMQAGIVVTADVAATLTISGHPSPIVAGSKNGFTILALDRFGNQATDYTGTVKITTTDGKAVLPADYKFELADNGTKTFVNALELRTVGTFDLVATDTVNPALTSKQTGIVVTPAAASTFTVSGHPSPVTAGTTNNITVTAFDPFGNVATNYRGTIAVTSTDNQAGLPANTTFGPSNNGVVSLPVTLKTAGTHRVAATDIGNSALTGSQGDITVTPAAANTISLGGFPSPTTAGTANSFTVSVKDAFGNTATGYTGTVAFKSTDSTAKLPGNFTFRTSDAGVVSFTATLNKAGKHSLTVTDTANSTLVGSQSNIDVRATTATSIVIGGFPSPTTAGDAKTFTISAFDKFGNVADGYTGTVKLSSSDVQASLPADYTFTPSDAGTKVLTATLKTAGTQSLTATDSANATLTSQQSAISVVSGPATQFFATPLTSPTEAGKAQTVTVTAKDAFGNLANGYTGTVRFSSTDSLAGLPADYTFTTSDAGTKAFSVTLKTAGAHSVIITDRANPDIKVALPAVSVTPAAATKFDVTNLPATVKATVPTSFVVTARDSFNNVATGYVGTITVDSSDPRSDEPTGVSFNVGDKGVRTVSGITFASINTTATVTVSDGVNKTIVGSARTNVLPNFDSEATLVSSPQFALGTNTDSNLPVRYYSNTGQELFTAFPFADARIFGGGRVSTADFNGDGRADLIVGTGPGFSTRVIVIDGFTEERIFEIAPFESTFKGGVYVATGDLNGDGVPEMMITPDEGGGPRVRVFDGRNFSQIDDFLGIDDPNFRGGARAAAGDVNGDGKSELVVAAGFGGGPRVAIYDGTTIGTNVRRKVINDFFVFEETLRNGAFITVGDLNGDGRSELIAGGGPGGGPRVVAFDGLGLTNKSITMTYDFFAGDTNNRGGVRLAVKDLDGDKLADLLTGAGENNGSSVNAYFGKNLGSSQPPIAFTINDFDDFQGGVFVG